MDGLPLFSRVIERRDPAERKHGGNAQSIRAHRKARGKKRHWYVMILREVRRAGSRGKTAKELAAVFRTGINLFSGRITELVAMGYLKRLKISRDGAGVLVYRKFGAEVNRQGWAQ